MHEAKIRLRAISPLFMRGADQRKAEFRSASVKGVMRWWFRALAGNYVTSDELREKEGLIFGSAGGRRSRVIVEARALSRPVPIYNGAQINENSWLEWQENKKGDSYNVRTGRVSPREKKAKEQDKTGLQYLFFSIKLLARRGKLVTFYEPNSKFEVTIKSHDSKAYEAAMASLWSAVALGGFGFRARRGAGSLWFDGKNGAMEALGLPTVLKSPNGLEKGIQRAIELVGNAIGKEELQAEPIVDYPTLTENSSAVAVLNLEAKEDPRYALMEFQEKYKSFRRRRSENDKKDKRENSQNNKETEKDNIARKITFGLPIVKWNLKKEYIGYKARKARRASPLLVSVKPFGGSYRVVLVKMKTKRFHENSELNSLADWRVLKFLDEMFKESVVFGKLDNFE